MSIEVVDVSIEHGGFVHSYMNFDCGKSLFQDFHHLKMVQGSCHLGISNGKIHHFQWENSLFLLISMVHFHPFSSSLCQSLPESRSIHILVLSHYHPLSSLLNHLKQSQKPHFPVRSVRHSQSYFHL